MINITIDKNGLDQLSEVLQDGILSLTNWSKPFKQFGVILSDEQKKNFTTGGAIYQGGDFVRIGGGFANLSRATTRSRAWQPLTAGTKKDRLKKGYQAARPILVRSGKLRNSFKTNVTNNSFTTENISDIAEYHQFGTKNMPARRIMGLSKKSVGALKLIIEKHIAGAFKMAAHNSGFAIIK